MKTLIINNYYLGVDNLEQRNILILCIFGVVLVAILALTAFPINFNSNNTTDEVNLTLNETNNTTDEVNQTAAKTTTKKSTSKSKSDDDGIYYDEELNEYFDKNDRTVYDGQVEKGTSKADIKRMAEEMEREANGY